MSNFVSLPESAFKIPKTIAAANFATRKHRGELRKQTALPYLVHCYAVYAIATEYKKRGDGFDELGAACLLHDSIENAGVTYEELESLFGAEVANVVAELTNDNKEIERIGKLDYINNKLLKLSNRALLIKLADMLANATDYPTYKNLERIAKHIRHLRRNRTLTETQEKVAEHIERHLEKI
ncbi:MAG: HD domain-containing protein [Alphaproteobacteria bacterium]|nr:HD domain-containing protein [Alphaproteobacteria bacterium]